jgi:hypothetical protein
LTIAAEIAGSAEDFAGREEVPPEVEEALYWFQDILLRQPMVTQAVFGSLVREGRRVATTPEGAALLDRLSRSASVARARMIWEVLSLNAFVEPSTSALPSVFLERVVKALAIDALEPLLSRIFEKRGP